MADKVVNIKVCNPLKLLSGLTGKYHAICHYSYKSPLAFIETTHVCNIKLKNHGYKLKTRIEKPPDSRNLKVDIN
jgi:hypothetical protein